MHIPAPITIPLEDIRPISSYHGIKEISDIILSYSSMIGKDLPSGQYDVSDAPQGLAEFLSSHPIRAIRTSKGTITPFWESEDSYLQLLADLGVVEHKNVILYETSDRENLPFARSHKNAVLSTHWYQSRTDPFKTHMNGKCGMSVIEWEREQYGEIRTKNDARRYLQKLEQSFGILTNDSKSEGVPSYVDAERKILPRKPENHYIVFPLLMSYANGSAQKKGSPQKSTY
jgi:hypothetical protein